jgi:hypothetical protein
MIDVAIIGKAKDEWLNGVRCEVRRIYECVTRLAHKSFSDAALAGIIFIGNGFAFRHIRNGNQRPMDFARVDGQVV